eukprot:1970190-Prymnesium_polylepis.1
MLQRHASCVPPSSPALRPEERFREKGQLSVPPVWQSSVFEVLLHPRCVRAVIRRRPRAPGHVIDSKVS